MITINKSVLPGCGWDVHENEQRGKILEHTSENTIPVEHLREKLGNNFVNEAGMLVRAHATIIKNHSEFSRQTGVGVSTALKCSLGLAADCDAEASLAMDWSNSGSTDSLLISLSCEVRVI
jgi:hypothetical protein